MRRHITAFGLVALVLTAFGQSVGFEFVDYDDFYYVEVNSFIQRGLTWEGLRWAFTADLTHESLNTDYWQPVTCISRMIDVELFGMNAGGHHLMNVLLHAVNALLVFGVFEKMTGRFWPGALIAAVFAAHPLRVGSVAWVTERKDILSALFCLLAIRAYLRHARATPRRAILSASGWMALGLMSKPMIVTLPAILLLLDFWPLRRPVDRRVFIEKFPLVILAAGSTWITLTRGQAFLPETTLMTQMLNAPRAYAWYIWKTVWPVDLACWYPYKTGFLFPLWQSAAACAALGAVTAWVIAGRRKRPYALVGWMWFLITLIPVVIGVAREHVADRFTYLPHLGLYLMAAVGAADAAELLRVDEKVLFGGATVLLTVLTAMTFLQTRLWRDDLTLLEHSLRVTRNNYFMHLSLGMRWIKRGDPEKALHHFREVLRMNPDFVTAHVNVGNALVELGRLDEAMAEYDTAIRKNPRMVKAHFNLANCLLHLRRYDDAIREYDETLRLDQTHAEAYNNMGIALYALGRRAEAGARFRQALEHFPGWVEAQYNMERMLKTEEGEVGADTPLPFRISSFPP